jgi:hypothetical protein
MDQVTSVLLAMEDLKTSRYRLSLSLFVIKELCKWLVGNSIRWYSQIEQTYMLGGEDSKDN